MRTIVPLGRDVYMEEEGGGGGKGFGLLLLGLGGET